METRTTQIVVYHCRNLLLFGNGRHKDFARSHPWLKLVAIPCSGKVEAHHLLGTLASGVEGVMVLACNERACQYLEGSMRSHKRLEYARSWLTEIGLEQERLEFKHLRPMDTEEMERIVDEFRSKLETLKKASEQTKSEAS